MNELQIPDELLPVLEQLATIESKPPISLSLVVCIERWATLVDEIGNYPGSFSHEYLHDLGARAVASLWLVRAREENMSDLLEWCLPILDEIDNHYLAKSRPDDEGLNWDTNRLNPHYWWLRRLPEDEGLLTHFRSVGPNMRQVIAKSTAPHD